MNPSTHLRRGLTLIEMLVVLLILGLLATFVLPPFWNKGCRAPSHRLICGSNLKGIGTMCKIYANDNGGHWPVPAFDESAVGTINYTVCVGGGEGSARSPSRSQPSVGGPGGARRLSGTRAFWTLVRTGNVTVKQFICPQSATADEDDPTKNIDGYYDFSSYANVSYGYQVPFGPPSSRPREPMDNRMVLAADKGPYTDATVATAPATLNANNSPKDWRTYNSRNHNNEGQNTLYFDGHVAFSRTPIVGIDYDNIYTVALDNAHPAARMIGESPRLRSAPPFTPLDAERQALPSTDSVIFP